MAVAEINEFLKLVPAVRRTPHSYLWSSYDAGPTCFTLTSKSPATPLTAS